MNFYFKAIKINRKLIFVIASIVIHNANGAAVALECTFTTSSGK